MTYNAWTDNNVCLIDVRKLSNVWMKIFNQTMIHDVHRYINIMIYEH